MKFIKFIGGLVAAIIDDALMVAGLGCIVYGVWRISVEGGLLTLGISLIVLSVINAVARAHNRGGGGKA